MVPTWNTSFRIGLSCLSKFSFLFLFVHFNPSSVERFFVLRFHGYWFYRFELFLQKEKKSSMYNRIDKSHKFKGNVNDIWGMDCDMETKNVFFSPLNIMFAIICDKANKKFNISFIFIFLLFGGFLRQEFAVFYLRVGKLIIWCKCRCQSTTVIENIIERIGSLISEWRLFCSSLKRATSGIWSHNRQKVS